MADLSYKTALIVGVEPGISASLARRLAAVGTRVGLAARNVEKLRDLIEQTCAAAFTADAGDAASISKRHCHINAFYCAILTRRRES